MTHLSHTEMRQHSSIVKELREPLLEPELSFLAVLHQHIQDQKCICAPLTAGAFFYFKVSTQAQPRLAAVGQPETGGWESEAWKIDRM